MKHLSFPAFGLLLSTMLTIGCTANRFYTPNTMQLPVLQESGQGSIRGGLSIDGDNTGWEGQAIYSPVRHLGIMASHFGVRYSGTNYNAFFSPFPVNEEFSYTGSSHLTEGGLGGYYGVGPEKEYLLSLFTGFGQGATQNRYTTHPEPQIEEVYNSEWRYQRWFIQPAMTMQYKRLQVGTGLRFAWVSYFDGDINSRVGFQETERIELLETGSPLFLTEMAWSIGWRIRPLVLSLNSTAVVRGKNSLRDLNLASNYVSLTVGLNLHELKRK
ncbi:MAG: hypothetical protein EP344_01400 [Bacteroidetes bacterium]|nr:MAG: hypothetical protein EP344_01400 [Bacteroidota bacterium]